MKRGQPISRCDRDERFEQRALHQRKDGLSFRVAEPTVELDDLRPIARAHEPRVEQPAEPASELAKRPKGRLYDSRYCFPNDGSCSDGDWRIRAHSPHSYD